MTTATAKTGARHSCGYLQGSKGCLTECGPTPRATAECGTGSGCNRHRNAGEPACPDCLAAHAAVNVASYRARRAAGGAR